ncbi:MAG: hypothetical protein ACI9N3_002603, partial [Colwellia sp.]
ATKQPSNQATKQPTTACHGALFALLLVLLKVL